MHDTKASLTRNILLVFEAGGWWDSMTSEALWQNLILVGFISLLANSDRCKLVCPEPPSIGPQEIKLYRLQYTKPG